MSGTDGDSASRQASPFATWREYCERGQLAYQQCPQTSQVVFEPRLVAPRSGSADLVWRISEGVGTVYSTTTLPAKDAPAANLALIDLDEGFRMLSRVEGMAAEQVRIGLRVRVAFRRDAEGSPAYPVFVALEEAR